MKLRTFFVASLLIAGCASTTPQNPQTRDGWAFQITPASDQIGLRHGEGQWMQYTSPSFQWFDSVQACEAQRAVKAAQIEKLKPRMVKIPRQDQTIGLSDCRQASVTVNGGGMWGYMKPDGSMAVGMTTERTCESALATDVIQRIMPIRQRNCVPVSMTWN